MSKKTNGVSPSRSIRRCRTGNALDSHETSHVRRCAISPDGRGSSCGRCRQWQTRFWRSWTSVPSGVRRRDRPHGVAGFGRNDWPESPRRSLAAVWCKVIANAPNQTAARYGTADRRQCQFIDFMALAQRVSLAPQLLHASRYAKCGNPLDCAMRTLRDYYASRAWRPMRGVLRQSGRALPALFEIEKTPGLLWEGGVVTSKPARLR